MAQSGASEHPTDVLRRLTASRQLDDRASAGTLPLDAYSLPDGKRAADRIRLAIERGERIGVIGDYDCDGITSAAQLVRMLRRHGCEPVVRLPHRVRDGYELKRAHIDHFADAGVTVLLIADNGITAVEAITHAAARGIDVIVLDHHSVPAELPPAYALVHPALGNLPGPHPSASGVVFAFLHLMDDAPWTGWSEDIALATFGMVADLVPLTGGNRRLVRAGLQAMNQLKDGPIAELVRGANAKGPVTSTDIAFRIAPRINAAGRMDDPMVALDALLHGGDALVAIGAHNAERQELQRSFMDDALKLAAEQADKSCICIAGEYPHGIIGLLAGKITETTGKPSLVCAVHDGVCTGSLRSPACCSIIEALRCAAAAMGEAATPIRFGGHAQAAGCTLPAALLNTFHEALCAQVSTRVSADDLLPSCLADALVDASAIDTVFADALQTLQPFGQGNPEPRFVLSGVKLDQPRRVGTEARHLQGRIGTHKLIGFGFGHLADHCETPVDVLCRVGMDTWNGRKQVQLFIEDLRETIAVPAGIAS